MKKFMRTLLTSLLVLLGLVILGVALIVGNPHWLSPLIEKELSQQGIIVEITDVKARLSGETYQLQATISGKRDEYGIQVNNAHIATSINWYSLLQKRPMVEIVTVDDGELTFEKQSIPQWEAYFNDLKKTSSTGDFSKYFPKIWKVNGFKLEMEKHFLTLAASGESDQQVDVIIKDDNSGYLTLHYEKDLQKVNLYSPQLNLTALTGHDAVLKGFEAALDTKKWANSTLKTRLIYQGTESAINIEGKDRQVNLTAIVEEQSIQASIRYDQYGAQLKFSDVDLGVLMNLKPLLPSSLTRLSLEGIADGVAEYDFEKGLRLLTANVNQGAIAHPDLLVNRLSASIWLQDKRLQYLAEINDGTLLFPKTFKQDSHRVNVKSQGTYDIDSKILSVDTLDVSGPDFQQLIATGSIQLPNDSLTIPVVDLRGELLNFKITKTARYLPNVLPIKAREWLTNAFVSGSKNKTTFRMKGALTELMEQGDSVFLVNSEFQNSVLHYLPNNPDVLFGKLSLTIDKKSLSAVSDAGKVGGLPMTASVDIKDLMNTVVEINAQMKQQKIGQMQAVAVKSIARKAIKDAEGIVKSSGLFDLDLSIRLDFSDVYGDDTFNVRVYSKKSAVSLKLYPELLLKDTDITVLVNESGLKSVKAKGKLNRNPIQINLLGSKKGYNVDTFVTAEAIKILPQLKLISKSEAAVLKKFKLLSGKSRYKASIDLAADGSLRQLDVTSGLFGTQINLFDAVKKTAKKGNILILTYSRKKQYFQFHIHKMLMIKAGFDKRGELAGLVFDNDVKKRTYKSGVIQFFLQSSRLKANVLNSFANAYRPSTKKKKKPKKFDFEVDVNIKKTMFKDGKSYPLSVKGNRANVLLKSPIIHGNVQYKSNQLNAQLERVEVDKVFDLVKRTRVNSRGRKVATISLANVLPQLEINVDNVIFKGKNVGNLHLETSVRNGFYSIDQGLLTGKNFFMEVSGHEAKDAQLISTHIQANFKGEKLADVIKTLSLNEVIDAKNLDISANLAWPGRAHTLNMQQSYGKARMSALNLKLVNVSSGLGSVFGLMDVAGILKRISLDFKNLNSSKISFDTIGGQWNIGGGRAVTRDFFADGSVIALKLKGPIDLHRHEFDNLKATVIPRASNVLPVVGAVAGGVVGAAAGFLVKQVIGDNLDEAVGIPYKISGTWENPSVDFAGTKKGTSTKKKN